MHATLLEARPDDDVEAEQSCAMCGYPQRCDCLKASKYGCEFLEDFERLAEVVCACCALNDNAPACCKDKSDP